MEDYYSLTRDEVFFNHGDYDYQFSFAGVVSSIFGYKISNIKAKSFFIDVITNEFDLIEKRAKKAGHDISVDIKYAKQDFFSKKRYSRCEIPFISKEVTGTFFALYYENSIELSEFKMYDDYIKETYIDLFNKSAIFTLTEKEKLKMPTLYLYYILDYFMVNTKEHKDVFVRYVLKNLKGIDIYFSFTKFESKVNQKVDGLLFYRNYLKDNIDLPERNEVIFNLENLIDSSKKDIAGVYLQKILVDAVSFVDQKYF